MKTTNLTLTNDLQEQIAARFARCVVRKAAPLGFGGELAMNILTALFANRLRQGQCVCLQFHDPLPADLDDLPPLSILHRGKALSLRSLKPKTTNNNNDL